MALFKKFTKDEISNISLVKASVGRGIRSSIVEQYPYLEETGLIDVLIPKKEGMVIAKCQNQVQVVVVSNTPLFFQERDGPWLPTLRLLHQYPQMMNRWVVDEGAIKFVLAGANIMCPGLTHPDAKMEPELEVNAPISIYGHGKEHAMAVGAVKMSTADIRAVNKGIGVDNLHHLADGLWKTQAFE